MLKRKEAEQTYKDLEEEEERKSLLFPPSQREKIEKLKQTNAELKENISDEVVERIEEELKDSRGDQQVE